MEAAGNEDSRRRLHYVRIACVDAGFIRCIVDARIDDSRCFSKGCKVQFRNPSRELGV